MRLDLSRISYIPFLYNWRELSFSRVFIVNNAWMQSSLLEQNGIRVSH